MVAAAHFLCGTCWKEFPAGWRARESHCNATGHQRPAYECDTCPHHFNSQHACNPHMGAKGHFGDYSDDDEDWECRDDDCWDTFASEADRDAHEHDDHDFCGDCDRYFDNANNLRMHLNSRTHRSDTLACPLCKRDFVSATGLAHHLERGACPRAPNLDRMGVYRLVRELDPHHWFTNRVVEYTKATYTADENTWNGSGYECSKCYREFRSLNSLNQHLWSGTHDESLYHCQSGRCGRQFKTFGAVCNHLESESCGAMSYDQVQKYMHSVVSSGRLLTAY
ncbi:Zinc finger protein [Vanrija pseudolonga]|uniref:Zinc finger protein n=1 Tax=Vanrija pseudolonga TaxID=143232 RepID=A0AAF0YEF3_9TREE|nr:Zinc finger protein [Vanrija pseudolonga]